MIGLVLDVVVFMWGTTVVVGNNRTTPTSSALDDGFSTTWLHVGNKISADYSAIGTGVLAQSLPDINSTREEGLSAYKAAAKGDSAPVASVNRDHQRRLADVGHHFGAFSEGTSSVATYRSGPAIRLMSEAASWARSADKVRESLLSDARRHDG